MTQVKHMNCLDKAKEELVTLQDDAALLQLDNGAVVVVRRSAVILIEQGYDHTSVITLSNCKTLFVKGTMREIARLVYNIG